MGSNADHTTKQAGSTSVALSPENARALQPIFELEEQPAAVHQPIPQFIPQPNTNGPSDARSGSTPSLEPALTKEQGLQEAELQPLQDADLVEGFSLPSPHSTAQSESCLDHLVDSPAADHSRAVEPASSLPGTTAAAVHQRKPAVPEARASPFALGHTRDPASSSVEQAAPEVPANSSLQPATPPLHTPTGQTPASRPASEQEGGEPPSTGAARQGSLQGIAKGIQAAIERKLRYIPWCSCGQLAFCKKGKGLHNTCSTIVVLS